MVDSRNLEAGINVVMIVCSGCNGHGSCNYTDIRTITGTNDNFRYATCICEPYWDGKALVVL